MNYPLRFEPGTRRDYGIGIDWPGRVVEKVSGQRVDQFCIGEIFKPPGRHDTAFEVEPHMAARPAQIAIRGDDVGFSEYPLAPPSHPEFYGLGHVLYSTAPHYMRFLRMVVNGSTLDGARVIGAARLASMLATQIGDTLIGGLKTVVPPRTADAEFFPGRRKTHSMGFMRFEEDVPGMRQAGSQAWAGVLNCHYGFDPKSDGVGVLMTQSLPFAEPRFMAIHQAFERAAARQPQTPPHAAPNASRA